MAVSKNPLFFYILLALTLTKIISEPLPGSDDTDSVVSVPQASFVETILDQLKSKLFLLELTIDERTRKLRSKDESIGQMEKIIQEKSESITLLQSEIESFQAEGPIDAKEQTGPHVGELEKQVGRLRKEIELQNKKKDAFEVQALIAEKKIQELSLKLENLQKVNDEQKIRIHKTEHSVQVAQEEMIKSKLEADSMSNKVNKEEMIESKVEADSMSNKVNEVHGEWLLQSLEVHLGYFQHYIMAYWNEYGRPAVDTALRKVLDKKAQVDKWASLHIKTISSAWIPMLKEWWLTCVSYFGTCISSVTTKTVELYHTTKNSVLHVNVQKLADPYMEEAKQFTQSFMDWIATMAKPDFDKGLVVLKPYTRRIVRAYKNLIKSAAVHHHQVQQMLKDNELTRPLATMELAWFVATALLALPVVFMFKLFSAIFSKNTKKYRHSSRVNHVRRGVKRSHPAK